MSALVTEAEQTTDRQKGARLLYVASRPAASRPCPTWRIWAVTDPALLTEAIAYTPADLAAATRQPRSAT